MITYYYTFTTTRNIVVRVPQLAPLSSTIIVAMITTFSIIVSIFLVSMIAFTSTQIALTIVIVVGSTYVPHASKGKAILMDDDVTYPYFHYRLDQTMPTLSCLIPRGRTAVDGAILT